MIMVMRTAGLQARIMILCVQTSHEPAWRPAVQ
jgi:hypothetical protein